MVDQIKTKKTKKDKGKQQKKDKGKQPKKEEYIYNPDTKRNVRKNGDVGKKVLEKYSGGTIRLSRSFYCCRTQTTKSAAAKQAAALAAAKPAAKPNAEISQNTLQVTQPPKKYIYKML